MSAAQQSSGPSLSYVIAMQRTCRSCERCRALGPVVASEVFEERVVCDGCEAELAEGAEWS